MPAVTRLGDNCTGHGCFPSRPSIEGSSTVKVDGKPVVCVDHAYDSHCCGIPCHGGRLSDGSPTVKIDGKKVGRIGDPIDCGSSVLEGSSTVYIDGR